MAQSALLEFLFVHRNPIQVAMNNSLLLIVIKADNNLPCYLSEFANYFKTVALMLEMTKPIQNASKIDTMDNGFCVTLGILPLNDAVVFVQSLIKERGQFWLKHVPLVYAINSGARVKKLTNESQLALWRNSAVQLMMNPLGINRPFAPSLVRTRNGQSQGKNLPNPKNLGQCKGNFESYKDQI
ncbi:hypothetical protein ACHAXS_001203, partial [Conticribra weissflogii]